MTAYHGDKLSIQVNSPVLMGIQGFFLVAMPAKMVQRGALWTVEGVCGLLPYLPYVSGR